MIKRAIIIRRIHNVNGTLWNKKSIIDLSKENNASEDAARSQQTELNHANRITAFGHQQRNEEAAVADAGFTQLKVKGARLHLCLLLVKRV